MMKLALQLFALFGTVATFPHRHWGGIRNQQYHRHLYSRVWAAQEEKTKQPQKQDRFDFAEAAKNRLATELAKFKDCFNEAAKYDVVPASIENRAKYHFTQISTLKESCLGQASNSRISESTKDEIGDFVQAKLLPYLLLGRTTEISYTAPYGYHGDFLIIDWLYDNMPAALGFQGELVDTCLLGFFVCNSSQE